MKKLAFAFTLLICAFFLVKYADDILLDIAPSRPDPLLPQSNQFSLAEYNCNIKIYLKTFDGKHAFETSLNKGVKGLVLKVGGLNTVEEDIPPHLTVTQLRQSLVDIVQELYVPFIAPRSAACPKPDIVSDPKAETTEKTLNPAYVTIDISARTKRVNDKLVMLIEKRYFRPGLDDKEARAIAQRHTGSLLIPFDMPAQDAQNNINFFFGVDMFHMAWNATID